MFLTMYILFVFGNHRSVILLDLLQNYLLPSKLGKFEDQKITAYDTLIAYMVPHDFVCVLNQVHVQFDFNIPGSNSHLLQLNHVIHL